MWYNQAMAQAIDLEPIIERAVKALVEAIDPERIILFGSAARGEFGEDSDLDLLVVVQEATLSPQVRIKAREALFDLELPKDLLYTFPDRFEARKHLIGTIEEPAHREGRVLYERP